METVVEQREDKTLAINFVERSCGYALPAREAADGFYEVVRTCCDLETFRVRVGRYETIERSFVYQGIPVLVPGASRETVICAAPDIKAFSEVRSTVTVTYECKGFPFGMKKVKDKFVIDYGSFSGSVHTDSDEHRIMVATEKIAKSL